MAGTLSRVTTFVAATPILSAEVNAELNQIVNLLNSTSSNIKLRVKVSDAGDAPLEADQLSTGPILRLFQAGILKASFNNAGDLIANGITGAAGVYTFGSIPVGPASNPTTANELARKQYVDDQRVRWSVSWLYSALPAAVETTESVQRLIVPDVTGAFIEDIVVVWAAGSDSGASNIFTIKKRNSSGTVGTDVGTIDVNTPAQNALNVNNITDYALAAGDQIYPLFTTRNTASEQMVTVTIRGYQKAKTT